MKYKLLFFIFLLATIINAQQKYFYGILKNNKTVISNAHIINLQNRKGTFSLDDGSFRILAKVEDSIRISAVGFKTKYFKIENKNFGPSVNTIELEKQTIELDEVTLKKHYLDGVLSRDMKQTPEDIAYVKAKRALDFSNIDWSKKVINSIDEISLSKPMNMRRVTDPTAQFAGVGTGISSGLDKYAQELKRQRKEITFKENFPKMLISEFGDRFFFNDLKIPKEKYYHFLDFCAVFEIEKLYRENKKLQLIDVLTRESKNYLKNIIDKE